MHLVELHDSSTGNSAKILAGLGFNCFSWKVGFDDGPRELLWAEAGFETGKQRPSGSGIPLLFPFPGRIGNAQFTFDNRTYLIPHDLSRPHALHGFVFDRAWRVIEQNALRVTAAFQASVDDEQILNHWPSDFAVEATYELAGGELRFNATFSNTGYDDLPWGFGTHPYFRLPLAEESSAATTTLTVPVDAEWELDDMLATGELLDLPAALTLSEGVTLGDRQFDTPYRLNAADNRVATVVADATSGRRVTQTFDRSDFPHVVIYTPGHREAVCIEPYSCVPDPFRLQERGITSGLRTLAAGESFSTSVTLRAE